MDRPADLGQLHGARQARHGIELECDDGEIEADHRQARTHDVDGNPYFASRLHGRPPFPGSGDAGRALTAHPAYPLAEPYDRIIAR